MWDILNHYKLRHNNKVQLTEAYNAALPLVGLPSYSSASAGSSSIISSLKKNLTFSLCFVSSEATQTYALITSALALAPTSHRSFLPFRSFLHHGHWRITPVVLRLEWVRFLTSRIAQCWGLRRWEEVQNVISSTLPAKLIIHPSASLWGLPFIAPT